MRKINMKRWLFGGFTASVVLFLLTGAMNATLLEQDFGAWMHDNGTLLHPPTASVSMILWTLMSFIYGFVGVGLYAGFRPRFGAGARPALFAGFILWLLSKLAAALDLIALGVLPQRIIFAELASSFFIMLIAITIGSWIYREA